MSFETIELTRQGPVAIVTLNRPAKLNAINAVMIDEINRALDEVESDAEVLALIVNGRGRAFCSGFDLQAGIAADRKTKADWRHAIDTDLDLIMRFWHCSKPTIAALHGHVLAGGFEIALACDISVCDSSAIFGEPELRFGSSIVAMLLPWYVNPKRAKKMLLTGQDHISAELALQYGLVNDLVPDGELLKQALKLAREIALMDPESVRLTKQAINQTYEIMGLGKALRVGADTSIEIESNPSELRATFNRILSNQGMKAALLWREARLKPE